MPDLREMIYSNDFADYLVPSYVLNREEIQQLAPGSYRGLMLNSQYSALFAPRTGNSFSFYSSYNAVPKLYVPLSTEALDASGITSVQNQSLLELSGRGVLIGFIDSGIDYRHPAFRDSLGRSRILRIWDQSIPSDTFPLSFPYGTEYTRDQLNQALASGDPFSLVPSRDDTGHGTALAGIAAGSPDPKAEFTGAAPEAGILMVKLKSAKPYLRDYFLADPKAPVYQENDIIAGFSYLIRTAEALGMPLILCLALGTNQGGHSGALPLSSVLNRYGDIPGVVPVAACGSEAGRAHHYVSSPPGQDAYDRVEILVPEDSRGFLCEIWGQAPQKLSVGFRSPAGETIPRIPSTLQQSEEIEFALEDTVIQLDDHLILPSSGSQLILLRFERPTPGIWEIHVYAAEDSETEYHIWLPVSGFSDPDITFLTPDPYTTLTAPSDAEAAISTGTYNSADGSLYTHSGRGFTRFQEIKPDLAAPGISLSAPGPQGSYLPFTGSSASAALTAGAAALLMEWRMHRRQRGYLTAYETKIYLIRGASRREDLVYPNREWGYGSLNLYQAFLSITTS